MPMTAREVFASVPRYVSMWKEYDSWKFHISILFWEQFEKLMTEPDATTVAVYRHKSGKRAEKMQWSPCFSLQRIYRFKGQRARTFWRCCQKTRYPDQCNRVCRIHVWDSCCCIAYVSLSRKLHTTTTNCHKVEPITFWCLRHRETGRIYQKL